MLKDTLVPGDEVLDSEGVEFKVLAATPDELVLVLGPNAPKEFCAFYCADRNEQGVWVFRDDSSIHLTEVL